MHLRHALALAGGLLAAPLAVAVAGADEPAPDPAVKKDLTLLTDGKGHYVAVVPFTFDTGKLFYGDGKTLYQQLVQGGGSSGRESFSDSFVDPRYPSGAERELDFHDGKYKVSCGPRETELKPVAPDEAKKILDGAKLEGVPRKWRPYGLARDDAGKYYYVDQGRRPGTEKSFRLFVGPKGNLKQLKMTNVVSDSEGDVFATKTGSLRLILNKNESTWIERGKQKKLLIVPVEDNLPMIFTDLGPYVGERLGTPCDDL